MAQVMGRVALYAGNRRMTKPQLTTYCPMAYVNACRAATCRWPQFSNNPARTLPSYIQDT